ncbi:MAG: DNA polymerase III subunit epsilon [Eggerthellaceae bacterium]|nr:DNA polymerase III subunit epsilon [Eggerthellaceae bacterium]
MQEIRQHILDGTPEDVIARYEALPELAWTSDFGALDRNVVVIDTETTGFSFNHDELIQIAAARLEAGEIVDWYVTFVNPGKPLPEDIIHLTHIHESDIADAPSPQEALAGLVEFTGDATMVAHNVGFDRTFVTRHPEGYPLLENEWIDTLDLSRIALPRLKSHRLIDLVHTFGAPVSTHRADDDVAATCVVYRILLAAVASMPPQLTREIANMATDEEWLTAHVFRTLAAQPADDAEARPLFSLRELRRQRILDLPTRPARKDADDLVGTLEFPTTGDIAAAFSASGALGAIYENYEPRDEQRSMATAIAETFQAGENLVVEAGTGVGKSMAYLVPAALLAQRNDIAVGIATKTNSLLDQLVYQELPALADAFAQENPHAQPLTWAPLKGMSHYPCLRKINRIVDDGPGMREVAGVETSQAPALAALLSYIEQSEYDDMDSLKIDFRALPRYQITTSSSECLRRKCPFFGKLCFAHGARRRAELVDVVVTNHTLLFCNVAADGSLLPAIRHWVIDEAHATENEARQAFAETVDSEQLARTANRVAASAGARNVFTRAERAVSAGDVDQLTLFFALIAKAKAAGEAFAAAANDYLARVKDLLYFDPAGTRAARRKSTVYDHVDIWINAEVRHSQVFADVAACAGALIEQTDKLIKATQDTVAYLEGIDEAAVAQRELASLAYDLRHLRNAAELIFQLAPESYAFQATLHRKKDRHNDQATALLLDVGEKMNEAFYTTTQSVIYVSATLTVGDSFESFKTAVGLGRSEFSQTRELQLESSYDFDNNMIVYVVKDMPEPNDPGYLDALNDLLIRTHRAQQGSMLTLFTNRREMERAYEVVNPALKPDDLRLVCQRYGVSVKGLRDDFLADEHLSLFALKSFWEGFDAPGATLRGVIIPKLPFARPTDPLYCERASRDDRAWWHYVLPQAVIETKQAAGRLIRKADDHGVLILADKRLVTKTYGKTFLKSLQSRTVRVCTIAEIEQSLAMMRGW